MKVLLITPLTPYKENRGGATGLPYHLLKERPKDIEVIVYSFNRNKLPYNTIKSLEKELNVSIKLLKVPRWIDLIMKLHLTFIRVFLKYPINYYIKLRQKDVKELNGINPDLIWGYTQEFAGIMKQFPNCKRLHTLPDCYSLHFYRRLGLRVTMNNLAERWNVILNYIKNYRMENIYDSNNGIVYHLVGEEDKNFLLEINSDLNANFIRHPHYEIARNRVIRFCQPKIKLLITGRYDLYCRQLADELTPCLVRNINLLKDKYSITFLGKDWENHVNTLRQAGYEVCHIKFAPDYIEEIIKHDIQLNPISIGTGTKGKVLDGVANGLLLLGTPYALENIAVEPGKSCVEWHNASEVPDILVNIYNNRDKYERMAEAGRTAVLSEHNPSKVSQHLFSLIK